MPVGANMTVRIPPGFSNAAIERARQSILPELRRRFSTFFEHGWDVFHSSGPIVRIETSDAIPESSRNKPGTWFDLNFSEAYYGQGYERGHLPLFAACAEWLEATFPGSEVWYGHDIDFENLQLFGPAERQALMGYYNEVGHDPYYEGQDWYKPSS